MSNTVEDRWAEYEKGMWKIGADYYKERIRGIGSEKDLFLLDLGCGPGQWAAAAAEEGMRVIGCDLVISETVNRLRDSVHLVKAGAEALPFCKEVFDVILCELVLPYVNVDRCMTEVSRIAKPNALFHGICHGPGYYLMRAFREAAVLDRSAIRRFAVLFYTVIHRTLGFDKYFFETFQTPSYIRKALHNTGFETLKIRRGGHPMINEKSYYGFTTFFEFLARKS